MQYTEITVGIFIQDIYGNLYTEDEWDGTQTANGVAVITENCKFVVPKNYDTLIAKSTYVWATSNVLVDGVTVASDVESAKNDYNGKENTAALLRELGENAQAAYQCSKICSNAGLSGYLPALGEYNTFVENVAEIVKLLNLI